MTLRLNGSHSLIRIGMLVICTVVSSSSYATSHISPVPTPPVNDELLPVVPGPSPTEATPIVPVSPPTEPTPIVPEAGPSTPVDDQPGTNTEAEQPAATGSNEETDLDWNTASPALKNRVYPEKEATDPNEDEPDIPGTDEDDDWLTASMKEPPLGSSTIPSRPGSVNFRAASWNLFKMTVKKARLPSPFTKKSYRRGAKTYRIRTRSRAMNVLEIMKAYDVDIVGFQEVNLWKKEVNPSTNSPSDAEKAIIATSFEEKPKDHPLLKSYTRHGYTILPGPPIYTKPYSPRKHKIHTGLFIDWTYQEYAPVAYRKSVMTCKSQAKAIKFAAKGAHQVNCTLKGATPAARKSFSFINTHLPASQAYLPNDLAALAKHVDENFVIPQKDVIIALDANSHPSGHLQAKWKEAKVFGKSKLPKGNFTKIHRKNKKDASGKILSWSIHINKTNRNRYIDDIIPILKPKKWCVLKSVLPVGLYPMAARELDNWKEYYRLSDHIPIIADFDTGSRSPIPRC